MSNGLVLPAAYPRTWSKLICHIGVGRFHRAHQAVYLHQLLQQGDGDGWGLCGIGIRPADQGVIHALRTQDHVYSVWELDGPSTRGTVVGSIMATVDAVTERGRALAMLSDPATRIISLTVTEAGYCLRADGTLDETHPGIAHDLRNPDHPHSAIGLIVRALSMRRAAGRDGVTLMSCDNMIENGRQLRAAVIGFAQLCEPGLARWIEDEASFPSSMGDRITPVPDPARVAALCARQRLRDRAVVLCEPWRQWILEDAFIAGRPAFESAGVILSADVRRYEDMKVGLLNGGHSALSHLGLMQGYTRVHEAMGDPFIAHWLKGYMREVAQTLEAPAGIALEQYQATLVERFANPAIDDRLQRLAADTSAKFLQALIPPFVARLRKHQNVDHLSAALTLWMMYLYRMQFDRQAREACQDVHKEQLLSLAATAVGTVNAAYFMNFAMPLPKDCARAGYDAIEVHLRGMKATGLVEHLRKVLNYSDAGNAIRMPSRPATKSRWFS